MNDAEAREWLTNLLPKAAHKKIDDILYEIDFGKERIDSVEIDGARVPVETITAHGLEIQLDANGNAATVTFPYGAYAAA